MSKPATQRLHRKASLLVGRQMMLFLQHLLNRMDQHGGELSNSDKGKTRANFLPCFPSFLASAIAYISSMPTPGLPCRRVRRGGTGRPGEAAGSSASSASSSSVLGKKRSSTSSSISSAFLCTRRPLFFDLGDDGDFFRLAGAMPSSSEKIVLFAAEGLEDVFFLKRGASSSELADSSDAAAALFFPLPSDVDVAAFVFLSGFLSSVKVSNVGCINEQRLTLSLLLRNRVYVERIACIGQSLQQLGPMRSRYASDAFRGRVVGCPCYGYALRPTDKPKPLSLQNLDHLFVLEFSTLLVEGRTSLS